MSKDPAFLFYYQDFLVGTDHMTLEQVGGYIKCLCHQAHRGSLRFSHMEALTGSQENLQVIIEKFEKQDNGEYKNIRLEEEVLKRKRFTASRLKNLSSHKGSHTVAHKEARMENENENENKDKKKNKRVIKKKMVEPQKNTFGEFKNILLTAEEFTSLKKRFPRTYQEKIDTLSVGIESKGYKYKSHYAAILAWTRKDEADRGKVPESKKVVTETPTREKNNAPAVDKENCAPPPPEFKALLNKLSEKKSAK